MVVVAAAATTTTMMMIIMMMMHVYLQCFNNVVYHKLTEKSIHRQLHGVQDRNVYLVRTADGIVVWCGLVS